MHPQIYRTIQVQTRNKLRDKLIRSALNLEANAQLDQVQQSLNQQYRLLQIKVIPNADNIIKINENEKLEIDKAFIDRVLTNTSSSPEDYSDLKNAWSKLNKIILINKYANSDILSKANKENLARSSELIQRVALVEIIKDIHQSSDKSAIKDTLISISLCLKTSIDNIGIGNFDHFGFNYVEDINTFKSYFETFINSFKQLSEESDNTNYFYCKRLLVELIIATDMFPEERNKYLGIFKDIIDDPNQPTITAIQTREEDESDPLLGRHVKPYHSRPNQCRTFFSPIASLFAATSGMVTGLSINARNSLAYNKAFLKGCEQGLQAARDHKNVDPFSSQLHSPAIFKAVSPVSAIVNALAVYFFYSLIEEKFRTGYTSKSKAFAAFFLLSTYCLNSYFFIQGTKWIQGAESPNGFNAGYNNSNSSISCEEILNKSSDKQHMPDFGADFFVSNTSLIMTFIILALSAVTAIAMGRTSMKCNNSQRDSSEEEPQNSSANKKKSDNNNHKYVV